MKTNKGTFVKNEKHFNQTNNYFTMERCVSRACYIFWYLHKMPPKTCQLYSVIQTNKWSHARDQAASPYRELKC